MYPIRLLTDLFQTNVHLAQYFYIPNLCGLGGKRRAAHTIVSSLILGEIRPFFVPDGFAMCWFSLVFISDPVLCSVELILATCGPFLTAESVSPFQILSYISPLLLLFLFGHLKLSGAL